MRSVGYAFNPEQFAFEAFEDEIVVLNLTSGTYYALGGALIEAWEPLLAGQTVAAIAAALADRHGVAGDAVEQDLAGIVQRLQADEVLRPVEASTEALPLSEGGGGYRPPTIEKHSDMEELLTLDPIHDIDPNKGWPYTQSR